MDLGNLDHEIEDWDLWNKYPEHRWIFNKLQLALDLGYRAGPCPTLPSEAGYYCIRPIYNLYGMGLNASKVWLDIDDNAKVMNLQHPGSFYCEWFDGPHYSIDYEWDNKWKPIHATQGYNNSDDLIHFTRWDRIEPPHIELHPMLDKLKDVKVLNIEFKDSKIIEVHLRLGNLAGDWYGLGDAQTIIPVWKSTTKEFIDQHKVHGYRFIDRPENATDKIENYRLGFLYK
jgi:hypothetical protein